MKPSALSPDSLARCWAEVELEALRNNLAWIRHVVGPDRRILTVVKADAYGHGLQQIAGLLMQSGTDLFGVANLAEARAVHRVGRGWPVLMLGPTLPEERKPSLIERVMLTVSSEEELAALSAEAGRLKCSAQIHLKLDTGMGRLGVRREKVGDLLRALQTLPALELRGVGTHFAAAEEDPGFTRLQRDRFRRFLTQLDRAGLHPEFIHVENSAGLVHGRRIQGNTVRPGLMVYGILPEGSRRPGRMWRNRLQPALTWKTRVGCVREVRAGETLSYGRTFTAKRDVRVAVLTAGYGDGYARAGSSRAWVLVRGRRCPVLGRITMDQTLVDVSECGAVAAGEEVVLLGAQGEDCIGAGELAAWTDTIPWEVLTRIGPRVPRLYRGSRAA